MKNAFTHRRASLACALFAVAGLAVASAAARQDRRDDQPRIDRRDDHNTSRDYAAAGREFRSYKWLSGADIYNAKGDHIADVSDLMINRGSGRVDYAILKTGTTLGMGGKSIAIPFNSLTWDAGKEHFLLDTTEDNLKTYPEFSPESWAGLTDLKNSKPSALREWLKRDRPKYGADPYASRLGNAEKRTIEGEIVRMDRRDTENGEQVLATVKDSSGKTHKVWLGPSWFVNASNNAPVRGDKVTVETYYLDRSNPDDAVVGRSLTLSGRELALRDAQGAPMWDTSSGHNPASNEPNPDNTADRNTPSGNTPAGTDRRATDSAYDAVTWRTLLASELVGRKIMCRGEECGKVNDLIVDRPSGQVAMISIDPNQNFLGIADTKHLVPWTVTSVSTDGTVRIDASKDMVLASPQTPSDLTKLNNGTTPGMVYKAYDVDAPDFKSSSRDWRRTPDGVTTAMNSDNAWRRSGPILAEVQSGKDQTISGTITDTTTVNFKDGTPAAKALKVKTSSGEETVLVGPENYSIKSEEDVCHKGDQVSIQAVKVRIDGKSYLLARQLESGGKSMTLIDSGNSPMWDRH